MDTVAASSQAFTPLSFRLPSSRVATAAPRADTGFGLTTASDRLAGLYGSAVDPPADLAPGCVELNVHDLVGQDYDKWLLPGERSLSRSDLDRLVKDPRIHGHDAAVLVMLVGMQDSGESLDRSKVLASAHLQSDFWKADGRVESRSHTLYEGSIDPQSLQQGGAPDCYFHAALDAEVRSEPDVVKSWIKARADGSYEVTLPGNAPTIVPAPTDAQAALMAHSNGLWGTVIDLAFEQIHPYDHGGALEDGISSANPRGHHAYSLTHWLCGHKALGQELDEALNGPTPRLVTADRRRTLMEQLTGAESWKGIVLCHAYEVESYDPRTGVVVLRNPWGTSPPDSDVAKDLGCGRFSMSLKDFKSNFSETAFEASY